MHWEWWTVDAECSVGKEATTGRWAVVEFDRRTKVWRTWTGLPGRPWWSVGVWISEERAREWCERDVRRHGAERRAA